MTDQPHEKQDLKGGFADVPRETHIDLPKSWKYKKVNIGPLRLPYYASPEVQLILVSFVCFMCPGMFNALSGMGGGGQVDKHAGDNANIALYSAFAVVGFTAGSITNRLGIKTTLCLGGLGYSLYIGSFLCYNHTKNFGFTVFAGFMLGICAALLWCAQGAIMLSYPLEKSKGKFISWFWMIFNLGAVVGGLIQLGLNIHTKTNSNVSDSTYIAFLVLTVFGAVLTWSLVDTGSVIRSDGSKVVMMKNPTWKTEIFGLYETLQSDPYIVFLFPMFLSSNWFYAYQFNDFNGAKFNTRTKALNSVLYYTAQIIGAFVFGYLLDLKILKRPARAKVAWVIIFIFTMAMWGAGLKWQLGYTRKDVTEKTTELYDWSTKGYAGPLILYMFYGAYDAAWQTTVYWMMGSLTNNSRKLANFAGFYKGVQSAGNIITWKMDDVGVSYLGMFSSCWALLGGSLIIALPVILTKITEHTELEADLKFSDETLGEVVAPGTTKAYGYEEA